MQQNTKNEDLLMNSFHLVEVGVALVFVNKKFHIILNQSCGCVKVQ